MVPTDPKEQKRIQFSRTADARKETREVLFKAPKGEYILSLPLSAGKCELESEGKRIFSGTIPPGTLRLASPQEELRAILKSPWDAIRFSIPISVFQEMLGDRASRWSAGDCRKFDPLLYPLKEVLSLGRVLEPALSLDPTNRHLLVDGVTRSLLAFMFHGQERKSVSKTGAPKLTPAEMQRCIDFADAHVGEALQVADWAASIGMSAGAFSRRFRAATGLSPYRWFLDWRLRRAQQLILGGRASLSEIATTLGFASQSHFTEAFRRFAGLSPASWKRAKRR